MYSEQQGKLQSDIFIEQTLSQKPMQRIKTKYALTV